MCFLKVPYYKKQVFCGFYIYKLVLPEPANSQNKEKKWFLHGLCSPPTGKTAFQQCFAMSSLRARHANSSVVGCKNPYKCWYSVPATEEQKRQWLHLIFNDNVPTAVRVSLDVCANHFTSDCFSNEGQYKAGFASTLTLVKGSVPTIPDPATAPEPQVSVATFW